MMPLGVHVSRPIPSKTCASCCGELPSGAATQTRLPRPPPRPQARFAPPGDHDGEKSVSWDGSAATATAQNTQHAAATASTARTSVLWLFEQPEPVLELRDPELELVPLLACHEPELARELVDAPPRR